MDNIDSILDNVCECFFEKILKTFSYHSEDFLTVASSQKSKSADCHY